MVPATSARKRFTGTLVWAIQDVAVGVWVDLDSISSAKETTGLKLLRIDSYANKTVKIRFTSTKSSGNNPQFGDIAIDDLSIDEAPTCPEPTAVTAVATSTTDVDVSWTTGGSTSWQIEYGAPGFTPGTGTMNALTNPFTVTGLTSGASTAYAILVVLVMSMWILFLLPHSLVQVDVPTMLSLVMITATDGVRMDNTVSSTNWL